jgi:uncharacterized protein
MSKFLSKLNFLPKNKLARYSIFTITSLVVLWLLGSLYLVWTSPSQIFKPERSYNVDIAVPYEQHFIENKYKENIDLWYIKVPQSKKVVLYLHGNSGRIPHFFGDIVDNGYSVLSPAYPGYHLSEGEPNTDNIYNSALVAYDWLVDNGWQEKNIIIMGHSMGGSPAVYLASKNLVEID